jgi:hypothetical protein
MAPPAKPGDRSSDFLDSSERSSAIRTVAERPACRKVKFVALLSVFRLLLNGLNENGTARGPDRSALAQALVIGAKREADRVQSEGLSDILASPALATLS